MSKKFGKAPPPKVNPPGRGLKTENPYNKNKKSKNIYKILVAEEDDQINQQKNQKIAKPNKKLENRKQQRNDDKSNPLNTTKEEDAESEFENEINDDLTKEVSEIKSILFLCSIYLSELKTNMASANEDFKCDAEGCDKVYKRKTSFLKHQVEKHGATHEIGSQDAGQNLSLNNSVDFRNVESSTQKSGKLKRKADTDLNDDDKKVRTEGGETSDEDDEPESPGTYQRKMKMAEALGNLATQAAIPSEQETQNMEEDGLSNGGQSQDTQSVQEYGTPDDTFRLNIQPNPNSEIIKELEDKLQVKSINLNHALAEVENLKTQLIQSKKERERLQIKLDKKEKELDSIVEQAQQISTKAASRDPKQLANEVQRLRKLNSELAGEMEDWKTNASVNADLSTRLEKSLKEAHSKIEYLEKRIDCRDRKCTDPKQCGKSHSNKFSTSFSSTLNQSNSSQASPSFSSITSTQKSQCNFYNRGVCKNDENSCTWAHNPTAKLKFLEEGQKKRKEEREKEAKEKKDSEDKDTGKDKEKKDKNNKKKNKSNDNENKKNQQDFQYPGLMPSQSLQGGMGPGSNQLNPMMTTQQTPLIPIPMIPQMNWQHQDSLRIELERINSMINWQTRMAPGTYQIQQLRQQAMHLENQLRMNQ